jgi:predicted nucleic acid-binding Zn ribbon protein
MARTGNSFNCFHPKWNTSRTLIGSDIVINILNKINVNHRKCKCCNKDLPLGKKGIFCNIKCRRKYHYNIKKTKSGKPLVWRGVRRPGL